MAIALHSTRAPIKGRETEREVKTIRELSKLSLKMDAVPDHCRKEKA